MDKVKQSDAAGDQLLELVHAITHQFRAAQFRALRDGPHALTQMDGRVLGFFARNPGATLSALAAHSGRDKAQLARLVKGLREQGLLRGEADAADRRNTCLWLTEAGEEIQAALRRGLQDLGRRAVAGLDAPSQAALLALLRQVSANLEGPQAA